VTGAHLHRGHLDAGSAAPAEYRVITPPGWDGQASLPLLLVLHGAASSAAILDTSFPVYVGLWSEGTFPPVIVGCVSTPTAGGFYLDPAGPGPRWESLVAGAFPAHLAERFHADLDRTVLLGSSMGGYGALKMAFREPGRFIAVASLAPTVFPGETFRAVGPRHTPGILAEMHAAMAGGTGDEDRYAANHVTARLRGNADRIRDSGLAIMLDCGDQDSFYLYDGAEYLHRVLWELGVSHDYHLIRGADHVGPERAAREAAAQAFLAAALTARS
jgi:S-formylglutathione hydrolase